VRATYQDILEVYRCIKMTLRDHVFCDSHRRWAGETG